MVRLFRKKSFTDEYSRILDEEYSRVFVRQVFDLSRSTAVHITNAIDMSTQSKATLQDYKDVKVELFLAILSISLAILKINPKIMASERAIQIESYCKISLKDDFKLTEDEAIKINNAIKQYQDEFKISMIAKKNPFGDVTGMMLGRSLGKQSIVLCLPNTDVLNPLIHDIVGNILTLAVTQVSTFWKNK
jgi:hypothetical protein